MRNKTKANKQVVVELAYNTPCNRLKQCFWHTTEGPLSPKDVKCVPPLACMTTCHVLLYALIKSRLHWVGMSQYKLCDHKLREWKCLPVGYVATEDVVLILFCYKLDHISASYATLLSQLFMFNKVQRRGQVGSVRSVDLVLSLVGSFLCRNIWVGPTLS